MIPMARSPSDRHLVRRPRRILIVDDHPIVRHGLAQLLNSMPDLCVVGEAGSASEMMKTLEESQVDLALIDISPDRTDGLRLVKHLKARKPDLLILVISIDDESVEAERVLRAGARGYLSKQIATKHVVEAVRRVLSGCIYLSES